MSLALYPCTLSMKCTSPAALLTRSPPPQVQRCLQDPKAKAAVFDDFHCVHCGSVKPAEWIATRKGKKEPYELDLSLEALEFLKKPMLVKVERVGDPPVKKIVEGPRRTDIHKAVRCTIDWAIKDYSAVATGKPKSE